MEERKRTREDAGLPLMREFDEGVHAASALMELCSKYPRLQALGRALQSAEAALRAEDARHISLFRLPTEILLKVVEGLDAVSSLCFASTCTEARRMFRDPTQVWLRRFMVGRGAPAALTCPVPEVLWRARQAGFGGIEKVVTVERNYMSSEPVPFQMWVGRSGAIVMAAVNHVQRQGQTRHQLQLRIYKGQGQSSLSQIVPLGFAPDDMTLHVYQSRNAEGYVVQVHGLHMRTRNVYHVVHNSTTKEHTETHHVYNNLGGTKVRILPHNGQAVGVVDNINYTYDTPHTAPKQHTYSTQWSVSVTKKELPPAADGTRSKKYEYVFRRFREEWKTDPLLQPIIIPFKYVGRFFTWYIHRGRLYFGLWVDDGLETQEIPLPPVQECAGALGIAANCYTLFAVIKIAHGSAFMNHYEMWARPLKPRDARWWRIAERCAGCGDKQIMASSTGVTMGKVAYVFATKPPNPEAAQK